MNDREDDERIDERGEDTADRVSDDDDRHYDEDEDRDDEDLDDEDLDDEDLDRQDDDRSEDGGVDGGDSDRRDAEARSGDGRSSDRAEGDRRRSRGRGRSTPVPADERARAALDFVSRVLDEMEMDCRARLRRPREDASEGEISIEIYGRDAGRIIGKKGQVLGALQFLVHRVVNRPGLDRRHVLIDAEGYRQRRDSTLASMARRLGKQAVDEGKIITFEPMNPRDRRVVHLALAKFEGVVTKSDGEGDDRRVQIIPVRRG
jgi:spoIIIJ-associated protein